MKDITKLLEQRAKLVVDARALITKAEDDKREPTAEERKQFDDLMAAADKLKDEVTVAEKDLENRKKLEAEEKELEASRGRQTSMQSSGKKTEPETRTIKLRPSIMGDCRNVICSGENATAAYEQDFRNFLRTGVSDRALQKDDDATGGYLSAPSVWMAELIQAVDDLTFMRQICRVLPPLVSADSIGAPSLDNDPTDPTWVAELAIGAEDSTMSFGKRELTPHVLAQLLKVSKTLLRRSTMGADAIVRSRLAYKTAIVMENAFITGDGAGKPLGVFTATSDGISTGRDISTGNTTSTVTFDGLKEAKYFLKGQYRGRAAWLFHRTIVKLISKLKDGEGRYLWEASVIIGDPDRILGMPVRESEFVPSAIGSGNYVGILGDFSNYWIVDALTATIQVLLELYAVTNQNGYITRLESDGMPVLEEAFVRVKLG